MSRVHNREKWMNTTKWPAEVTNPGPVFRTLPKDYAKTRTFTDWLMVKHGISYKAYRRKSKSRRDELKEEYVKDTCNLTKEQKHAQYAEAMELLYDCHVPFAPDGTPLGI